MTANREHIRNAIVAQFQISRELASAIIDEILIQIADHVMQGHRVELRGFGVFEPVLRSQRLARNPKRPEVAYIVPPRKSIRFRLGKTLDEVLNQDEAPASPPEAPAHQPPPAPAPAPAAPPQPPAP